MQRLIASTVITSLFALPVLSVYVGLMPSKNVLLVQLCASGRFVEIDLGPSGGNKKDGPPTPAHKSQACHAVCCRKFDLGKDDDGGTPDTI